MPGIVLTTMLCTVTWYLARKHDYPRMPKATLVRDRSHAFRESIWGLMLVVIIIGGIYSGLFTATEAAAMSAVYAFFIAVFVYKDLKLEDVPRVLLRVGKPERDAALHHHQRGAVLVPAANENIPQALADWMLGPGSGLDRLPAAWSTSCCCSPATSWSRPRSS